MAFSPTISYQAQFVWSCVLPYKTNGMFLALNSSILGSFNFVLGKINPSAFRSSINLLMVERTSSSLTAEATVNDQFFLVAV